MDFKTLLFTVVMFAGSYGELVPLGDSNFTEIVNAHNDTVWFIKFFMPWCIHCQRLKPIWDEFALNMSGVPKTTIAEVNCQLNPQLDAKYADGYPTLLLFDNGSMYRYRGDRTVDAFRNYTLGGYNGQPRTAASEQTPSEYHYIIVWYARHPFVFSCTVVAVVCLCFYCCTRIMPGDDDLKKLVPKTRLDVKSEGRQTGLRIVNHQARGEDLELLSRNTRDDTMSAETVN